MPLWDDNDAKDDDDDDDHGDWPACRVNNVRALFPKTIFVPHRCASVALCKSHYRKSLTDGKLSWLEGSSSATTTTTVCEAELSTA